MRPLILAFCLLGTGLSPSALAAEPPPGEPASTNVPGAAYPRIDAEGRGYFQLKAPDATAVQVNLPQGSFPLTKGADGVWSVTTPPLEPGFHYYAFRVDGALVFDPGSQAFYGAGRHGSGIEVPEPGVDFYALKDVPHGDVRFRNYFSKITGQWRRCLIYTPPGYDTDLGKRYPVLYLQHGSYEDETSWFFQGRANLVLDNLIAAGKAVPMLVVMDNCYAAYPNADAFDRRAPTAAFPELVTKELLPMIDRDFRTVADRRHRAVAGLSMGGNMAFRVAVPNLDLFANIGSFSGTMNGISPDPLDRHTFAGGAFADGAAFNAKLDVLWIGMGTNEPDIFPKAIGAFRKMLDESGIEYVYVESEGTRHEWLTWRRALHDFAPRLFRF